MPTAGRLALFPRLACAALAPPAADAVPENDGAGRPGTPIGVAPLVAKKLTQSPWFLKGVPSGSNIVRQPPRLQSAPVAPVATVTTVSVVETLSSAGPQRDALLGSAAKVSVVLAAVAANEYASASHPMLVRVVALVLVKE